MLPGLFFSPPPFQMFPLTNWSDLTPADVNCTYGIQWIWKLMGQCVMDTRGVVAMVFGIICLLTWIISAMPQIIENFRTGIPDQAISPFMLLFWFLGDSSCFLGALLTHQLILQIVVSAYSVINDLILFGQFFFYKMRHQVLLSRISRQLGDGEVLPDECSSTDDAYSATESDALLEASNRSRGVCYLCLLGFFGITAYHHSGSATPSASKFYPFSRQLLSYDSSKIALADGSLVRYSQFLPTTSSKIGYALGCFSCVMYVSSRLPQIFKNFKRGSTEGLCIYLFFAALIGNLSYGLQIFVTSIDPLYLLGSLPWLVGSVGVMGLDLIICFQFYFFGRLKRQRLLHEPASPFNEPFSSSRA